MCAHWPLLGWNIRAIKLRLHLWLQEREVLSIQLGFLFWDRLKKKKQLSKWNRLFGWFRCSDDGIEEAHKSWSLWGAFCHRATLFPFTFIFGTLWGASCHHFSQFFLLQHFWNPVGNTSAFCPNHFHVSKWSGSLWGARCHYISLSSTAAVPCLVRFLTLILGPDCTMYNLITDRVVRHCCQIY